MEYIEKLNVELKPKIDEALNKTALDLFAGCGVAYRLVLKQLDLKQLALKNWQMQPKPIEKIF